MQSPVGTRSDPYLNYRFVVQVGSLLFGGFSEVTGLEVELQTETYEEGGVNTHVHTLPTRFDYPNLVLQRGMTDSQALWRWIEGGIDGNGSVTRQDGTIFMLDESGVPTWGWGFERAYPVTWSGPELRADSADVAVERLELTHEGLLKIEGLPVGIDSIGDLAG